MTTETDQTQTPDTESKDWKQARAKIAKLEARNAFLQQQAIKAAVSAAGFDPSKGLTKLVIKEFEAQLDEDTEITSDAFTEFATEQGLTPEAPTEDPPAEDRTNETDQAQLQGNADRIAGEVTQPPAVTELGQLDERIAQAEKDGDAQASAALKFQRLRLANQADD